VDRRKGSQRHVAHRLSEEECQRILLEQQRGSHYTKGPISMISTEGC
jgi:hypothetical protein